MRQVRKGGKREKEAISRAEKKAKCRIYSESDWLQVTIGTVGIVRKNYRHAEPLTTGFSEVKSVRISAIQAPPPISRSEHDISHHYRNLRSFIFLVTGPFHKIYIRDLLRIGEEALDILKTAECSRNLKKKFRHRNSFCQGV